MITTSRSKEEVIDVSGARILLVEDDEILRGLLTRNLQIRGHTVSTAEDAQSALAHLRKASFDLIGLGYLGTRWAVFCRNIKQEFCITDSVGKRSSI